jgi:hypothetical protein
MDLIRKRSSILGGHLRRSDYLYDFTRPTGNHKKYVGKTSPMAVLCTCKKVHNVCPLV